MIPLVPVGKSGISVTRIGFGGAPIGDLRRTPTEAEAHTLLDRVWDAGIRYFDTAPFYGSGLSERRIGDFLRDRPRDSYVLSTKAGRLLVPDRAWAVAHYENEATPPFRPVVDFSYDAIMKSFEHSLQRLALDRIDMLLLHDIGRFSQQNNHEAAMEQALAGGGLRALEELRSSGAVRAMGVGVNEWQVLDELMDHARFDVFLLANRYTLLDQAVVEDFLPRAQREGISVIVGAALNSGILLTGAVPGAQYDYAAAPDAILEKTRAIEGICNRHGVPLIRAALNFPLGHPGGDGAAVGHVEGRPAQSESPPSPRQDSPRTLDRPPRGRSDPPRSATAGVAVAPIGRPRSLPGVAGRGTPGSPPGLRPSRARRAQC